MQAWCGRVEAAVERHRTGSERGAQRVLSRWSARSARASAGRRGWLLGRSPPSQRQSSPMNHVRSVGADRGIVGKPEPPREVRSVASDAGSWSGRHLRARDRRTGEQPQRAVRVAAIGTVLGAVEYPARWSAAPARGRGRRAGWADGRRACASSLPATTTPARSSTAEARPDSGRTRRWRTSACRR